MNIKRFFILAAMVLMALALAGQKVDTSYASLRYGWNPISQDSIYFEAVTTVYENGETDRDETAIGDTLAVINYFTRRANERAAAFTKTANEAWRKGEVTDFLIQSNNLLSTLFDTSLTAVSVAWYGSLIDGTSWSIDSGGSNYTGTLSVHSSGDRLEMAIGQNTFSLYPIGNYWIRFMGVPSGSFTDLHRVQTPAGIEFRSLDYIKGQRGLSIIKQ